MYKFYIGGVLLPITPGAVTMTVDNKDETVDLINGGTYTVFNPPGLTEWEFEFRLPSYKLPFAQYENGFKEPQYYINHLENLKASCEPFRFIMVKSPSRSIDNLNDFHDTNVEVSLSDFVVTEDAEEYGTGKLVTVTLKQYKHYETGRCSISESESGTVVTVDGVSRYWIIKGGVHISKQGETLRSIAFNYFGSEKYAEALAACQTPPIKFTLDPLPEFTVLTIDKSAVESKYEEVTITPAKPDIWNVSTYTNAIARSDLSTDELNMYTSLIKNAATVKYKTTNSGGFWKKLVKTLATPITEIGSIDDIWKKKSELAPYNEQAPLVHFMFTLKDMLDYADTLYDNKVDDTLAQMRNDLASVNQSITNMTNTINSLNSQIDVVEDRILESDEADPADIALRNALIDARDKLTPELKVLQEEARTLTFNINNPGRWNFGTNMRVKISVEDGVAVRMQEALNRVKVDTLSATIHTTWVQETGMLGD